MKYHSIYLLGCCCSFTCKGPRSKYYGLPAWARMNVHHWKSSYWKCFEYYVKRWYKCFISEWYYLEGATLILILSMKSHITFWAHLIYVCALLMSTHNYNLKGRHEKPHSCTEANRILGKRQNDVTFYMEYVQKHQLHFRFINFYWILKNIQM